MNVKLLYITCKTKKEATRISERVVTERLAACSNILGDIDSIFFWSDNVCNETEVAFLLKTSREKTHELIHRVKELHSYDVPCIIELSVTNGNTEFLNWVTNQTN